MDAVHVTAFSQPCFKRELVYAKSSTSRWIASRSCKLSAKQCRMLRVTAPPHRRAAAVCPADRACCLQL
jgi:hypothetical protein